MNIAVVGAGVSGLVSAYVLSHTHQVTLIEAQPRLGGHTHTHRVPHEGQTLSVDTGFIVFNERNYPHFCRLLERLGVASRPTTMSFSVKHESSGVEYGGMGFAGVFAQRRNLLRPSFHRMLRDIMRLGRESALLADEIAPTLHAGVGIGELLRSRGYSRVFIERYLVPMGAAIWSASQEDAERIPARFFLRFFHNHGMLDLSKRPTWRTVVGGSHTYVRVLRSVLDARGVRVLSGEACRSITRRAAGVHIRTEQHELTADHVVLACHSDEALSLLADASPIERDVLGAMKYQCNDVVLHRDASLLPTRRAAWAAWNATVPRETTDRVLVTYNMNMLQGFETREPLCVTLNQTPRVDPRRVIARMDYAHPAYTPESFTAQSRHAEISGNPASGFGRTHFCGAYWGNGFHEDGVVSSLCVGETLGCGLDGAIDGPREPSRRVPSMSVDERSPRAEALA